MMVSPSLLCRDQYADDENWRGCKMKRLVLGGLIIAVLGSQAWAADWTGRTAPVPATEHNWTGFYIGGHLGYGIDKQRATGSSSVEPSPLGAFVLEPGGIAELRRSSHQSRFRSLLGGVQMGYNYQYGRFVFGAEGDVTFGNLRATAGFSDVNQNSGTLTALGAGLLNMNPGDVVSFAEGSTFAARHRLGTFGTLRARAGYAFDRYLVYLTGGVAVADMQTSATATNFFTASPNIIAANPAAVLALGTTTTGAKTSRFAVGGAFGGGLEVALTRNWSVKAEYLYIAMPNQNIFLNGNFRSFSNTFHVARAGINYRF